MAQALADRWRFSSVDESAGLGMTSRLCYPIIPCPALHPRSPRPVPPHREDMMGWWMIGAVREGRENEGKNTLATFVLRIFSYCYSKHTKLLLLLYRRKQAHAYRVASFPLVIYAKEQWLISRSIIYRLLPSLNRPIIGVYVFVFVLLWWGWVGREPLQSWTANQWCFSAKSLSLSCTHFSTPTPFLSLSNSCLLTSFN